MRSLKTARPLLASVAYFVLFAMILFSCAIFLRYARSQLNFGAV